MVRKRRWKIFLFCCCSKINRQHTSLSVGIKLVDVTPAYYERAISYERDLFEEDSSSSSSSPPSRPIFLFLSAVIMSPNCHLDATPGPFHTNKTVTSLLSIARKPSNNFGDTRKYCGFCKTLQRVRVERDKIRPRDCSG